MMALSTGRRRCALIVLILTLAMGGGWISALITPPRNNYLPAEDVELGREAAAEIHQRLPALNDAHVDAYVEGLGRRLLAGVPATLRQPLFQYTLDVLNLQDLGSVALPGGPIFVTRGMMEAAETEGELVGVLAHQLSHIVLRHGTAQSTSGERFQIGAIGGRRIGAVGSGAGVGVFAQGSNFATSTYFLMYDHENEHQADLLAARLLARAGYDPREIVRMFHLIESQGGGRGGPQWKVSHPDPGDRGEYASRDEFINREGATLGIDQPLAQPGALQVVQIRLREIPSAQKATDALRGSEAGFPSAITGLGAGIPGPSGGARSEAAGDSLLLTVPANWLRVSGGNTVTFAPEGVVLDPREPPDAFTHGIQMGVARSLTGNLERDTLALLQSLGQNNPHLRWTPLYQRIRIARRDGLTAVLSNVSRLSGEFEQVSVSTAHLPGGSLLYVIGVAPQMEAGIYRNAFNRVLESIQIVD